MVFDLQGVSTNRDVRISNQKNIVNALFRRGPMTKQQLAEQLGLSLPTVSIILKDLGARGLVARGEKLESSGGRPASHITLIFDARLSVGVSISAEHVRFALVNLGPKIIAQEKHRLHHEEGEDFWLEVRKRLDTFVAKHVSDPSRVLGLGIALNTPLIMDRVVGPSSIQPLKGDWNVQRVLRIFGENTEINNTAKMAGCAQAWGGVEAENFVYLMLDRGVGGAIIADRHVIGGISKNAEFGHMVLDDGGPLCSCGQRGCFGRYCSSMVIMEESGLSLPEFFDKLELGNARCKEIWERYLQHLAMGINNIRLIFDTDIVIGGEMSQYIRPYEAELRSRLTQRNPFGDSGDYLRIGNFGEYDAALGAALVHVDRFLS